MPDVSLRVVPERLILEGTDGVGKTTVATRIATDTGATYLHAGPPIRRTWQEEYLASLYGYAGRLVLDRWHLGEAIWPGLFSRESLIRTDDELVEACDGLADLGFVMWVIRRPISDITQTLTDRGEASEIVVSIAAQGMMVDKARWLVGKTRLPIDIVDSDEVMEVQHWSRV